MILSSEIQIGNRFKHCGKTASCNKGKVCEIISINAVQRKIVVGYEHHSQLMTYSQDWFINNMELFSKADSNISVKSKRSDNSDHVADALAYMLFDPTSNKPPRRTFEKFEHALSSKNAWWNGHNCHIIKIVTDKNGTPYRMMDVKDNANIMAIEFNDLQIEEEKMKTAFLLKVGGKVVKISAEQAELLGGNGKHDGYRVQEALELNGRFFKANEIGTTKQEVEAKAKEEMKEIKISFSDA